MGMKRRAPRSRNPRVRELERELDKLREQLRDSRERYQLVVEHVPAQIVSLDADGRVRFANHHPPGTDQNALIGKTYADLIPADYRHELEDTLRRILNGGGPIESVTTGTTGIIYRTIAVPVVVQGRIDGVLMIATDITEQRRIESELRESESRHRSLLEGLPDYVGVIDSDRRITYVNRTGPSFTLEQVVGSNVYATIAPAFRDRAREAIDTAFRTGEVTEYATEVPEAQRHYSCRCAPVVIDGETAAVIVIATDVSDRVRAEKRLRLADRMTSMGSLVAGLAHELQNPLTYVIGNLSYALGNLDALQHSTDRATWLKHRANLQESLDGARRAAGIISDLSTFARGDDETETKEVDLRPVLQSCIRMASNEIRHRARLVVGLDGVPPVSGNASRLGQVFLNLIMNASQAIPDGAASDHVIEVIGKMRGSDTVAVEVRDTGHGIPDDIMERLFDPFFTTKSVGEGTGLGLSICNEIVTSLGGRIEVESAVGRGSVFRVLLPRFVGQRDPAAPAAASPGDGKSRRRRILIIDDDDGVRRSLELLLEHHEVVGVSSGREALQLLETDSGFTRILCDLMMPNMSGIDVFHELARRPGRLHERIVFITGGAFSPRARSFLRSIDNLCLAKPFNLDELETAVRG